MIILYVQRNNIKWKMNMLVFDMIGIVIRTVTARRSQASNALGEMAYHVTGYCLALALHKCLICILHAWTRESKINHTFYARVVLNDIFSMLKLLIKGLIKTDPYMFSNFKLILMFYFDVLILIVLLIFSSSK